MTYPHLRSVCIPCVFCCCSSWTKNLQRTMIHQTRATWQTRQKIRKRDAFGIWIREMLETQAVVVFVALHAIIMTIISWEELRHREFSWIRLVESRRENSKREVSKTKYTHSVNTGFLVCWMSVLLCPQGVLVSVSDKNRTHTRGINIYPRGVWQNRKKSIEIRVSRTGKTWGTQQT